MKKFAPLFLTAALLSIAPSPVRGVTFTAQQAVEKYLSNIQQVDFTAPENEIAKRSGEANAFLDFEILSQKSLPSQWEKLTPQDREAFLNLIKPLVAYVAYPKGKRLLKNNPVDYTETKPEGSGYRVSTLIREQEKALDVSVIYHLYESSGSWKIDDVVLDDVSISEDLRYQFEKILKDSGFPGLLQKMRERLERAKKEAPVKQSADS